MDIIAELTNALIIDPEDPDLGSLYDDCVREDGDLLYIDGIVYEILNHYYSDGINGFLFDAIDPIITEWAKSKGGDYYDFQTPSILMVGTGEQ